jgi:hypothetical protein
MAEEKGQIVKKGSSDSGAKKPTLYYRDHASRGPGEMKWNRGENKLMEIILKFVMDRCGYEFVSICSFMLTFSGDPATATRVLTAIIEDNADDFQGRIPTLSQVRSHVAGENASQEYRKMCLSMCFL